MTDYVSNPDKKFKPESHLKIYSLVADSLAETDVTEDTPQLPGDIGSITDLLPEIFITNPDIVNHTLSPHATTTLTEPLPPVLTFLNTLPLLALENALMDMKDHLLMINISDPNLTLSPELKKSKTKSSPMDLLKLLSLSMKTF